MHRSRFPLLSLLVAALFLAGCAATNPTPAQSTVAPATRDIQLFSSILPFDDAHGGGLPHDVYVPDHIIVHKGDTVVLHVHNTEDTNETHTFSMDAPYAALVTVPAAGVVNVTFVANTAGICEYRCTEHLPTMVGQLLVVG